MFKNIGGKIKLLSKIICFTGIVIWAVAAIASFILVSQMTSTILAVLSGIGVFIIGFLISWLGVFFMYGFGEIVVKLVSINEKINNCCSATYDTKAISELFEDTSNTTNI